MSWGVGHRSDSDPILLWLWCRPIQPLPWELPCATGAALKKQKDEKKIKNKKEMAGRSIESRDGCGERGRCGLEMRLERRAGAWPLHRKA